MRKKTCLSLYKRAKRKTQRRPPTPEKSPFHKRKRFNTPKTTPSKYNEISNKRSGARKWPFTPRSTPSKRWIHSPSPRFVAVKLKSPPSFQKRQTPSAAWIDIEETHSEDFDEEYNQFALFKTKLVVADVWNIFFHFMALVSNKSFPLNNISFLQFLDTVKFFSCKSTSAMTYFTERKRFWKTGYRLFHAKFLYFMGGPKNVGSEEFNKGIFSPENSKINFAVPSVNTLENFRISEITIPKRMQSGIIEPVLQAVSKSVSDKRFMLCADAKKVTAGIDKVGGDVDLFGFEDGVSLSQRQERLSAELNEFNMVLQSFQEEVNLQQPEIVAKLRNCCTLVSKRILEAREMKTRQEFGLAKFMSLGGIKWRDSKYVYAISALQTSLYQLKDFLRNALHLIHQICKVTSIVGNSIQTVTNDLLVIKGQQSNLVLLNPNYKTDIIDPPYIIQRTPLWQSVRKQSRVTGSTLHDAIGLRGLQSQKNYMEKLLHPAEFDTCSEELQAKLDYGSKNEENAIATIVAVVLPTFFPNSCFVEEGCHLVQGEQGDILMVVSPDGSIREPEQDSVNKVVAAIEVKCPFPKQGKVSLHYNLPRYYVCQCLAEMHVLHTERLIYVSWSSESATVLEVKFDAKLFSLIFSLAKDTYDNKTPKRPSDSPARLKEIKLEISRFVKSNVEFLAEVPSARMGSETPRADSDSSPYIFSLPKEIHTEQVCLYEINDSVISTVKRGMEIIELAYDLQRRKATEVMVWVLTHINRDTSTELPCSVPIAFGLKDYKLTSNAMRLATDYVIKKCEEYGIQICTLSADGQWIQLMTRDINGSPLTLLQHQKDLWSKVQKMSKTQICKLIAKINKVSDCSDISLIVDWTNTNGKIEVRSKEKYAMTVKTPDKDTMQRLLRSSMSNPRESLSNKEGENNCVEKSNPERARTASSQDWMPVQLVTALQDLPNNSVEEVYRMIDDHVNLTPSNISKEHDLNVSETEETGTSANETFNQQCDSERDRLSLLAETALRKSNITKISKEDLSVMFQSAKLLTTLTHKELDLIILSVIDAVQSQGSLKKSWKKEKKVAFLKSLINSDEQIVTRRVRCKNPTTLSSMCEKIIRSRKMSKPVLNVVYASCIYDEDYASWKATMPNIPLPDIFESNLSSDSASSGGCGERTVPYWYSFPEAVNGNLVCKSIDCSHNLTHLRVRSCTTGIGGIPSEAWKVVSKSNETKLSQALVDDLIDKQSVPNARTNFCIEVEECMRAKGYPDAAELTKTVRNWYDLSDSPGISAEDRVKNLIQMRKFLLRGVSFKKFPPPSRYINGIPIVTFEGILLDIDTKIQLHGITGPYNIRSVGSLAAETTVGVLQQLNPVSSVSIKARDVPSLVAVVVEVLTCRLDPSRGFFMRTSKRSGVYPFYEADHCESIQDRRCTHGALIFRNHPFDDPNKRKARRKIKFGTVSGPSAPSRGALPVRQFHRKDESKILPSKRLGIEMP